MAHLIAAGARLQAFSLGKQTIAGTKPSAIAQSDSTRRRSWTVIDNLLVSIVGDENLEPIHQIRVTADKIADLMHKHVLVDEVLGEEVAELQELVHG